MAGTLENETGNKLYEILPNLKESLSNAKKKQESVTTRLRIGHT